MTRKEFDKFKQVISQMRVPVEVQLEALLAIKEHCLNHIGEATEKVSRDCNGCFGASFGDCETCLHIHSTSQICDKCDGETMYEPYIP